MYECIEYDLKFSQKSWRISKSSGTWRVFEWFLTCRHTTGFHLEELYNKILPGHLKWTTQRHVTEVNDTASRHRSERHNVVTEVKDTTSRHGSERHNVTSQKPWILSYTATLRDPPEWLQLGNSSQISATASFFAVKQIICLWLTYKDDVCTLCL
jgi:hypothetical protein